MDMVHCRGCGKHIHKSASTCPHCGATQALHPNGAATASSKQKVLAAVLCWCFGIFGVHRLYVGKVGTGLIQLFTLGGLGVWAFVDFIMILSGKFRDESGKLLIN